MRKHRRVKAFFIFLVLVIIAVIVGLYFFYTARADKRRSIEDFLKNEMILRVEYGEVIREHKLKETNALFKREIVPTYLYLYIDKDNTLLLYHTETYYSIDPLRGIVVEKKEKLTNKQVNNITESLKEIVEEDLNAKIKTDYMPIRFDGENYFVNRYDFNQILVDNGIIFNVNENNKIAVE